MKNGKFFFLHLTFMSVDSRQVEMIVDKDGDGNGDTDGLAIQPMVNDA